MFALPGGVEVTGGLGLDFAAGHLQPDVLRIAVRLINARFQPFVGRRWLFSRERAGRNVMSTG